MIRKALQLSIRLLPWQMRGAIRYLPGVAVFQRWILRNFLTGAEFVHVIDAGPAKGLVFPVVLPDDKCAWTGTYESDFVNAITGAIRPGDICIDIGGWRGYCGGAMATHQAGEVFIFEPLPDNCERVKRLISLNPRLPIHLVEAAVGAEDGVAMFSVLEATSMGKLSNSPFQPDVPCKRSIEVEVVSLDSWLRANGIQAPRVIKIDVEGAELNVLRGAVQTLLEFRPTLFVECHSRRLTREICGFLKPLGYIYKTLETKSEPDGVTEPEVCHLWAMTSAQTFKRSGPELLELK